MFTFNGFLAKLKTKFSTNKTPTSSHRFPLVLSDGTPDGNATAADIQTLLGVAQYHTFLNSGNFNDLLEPGTWLTVPSSITNGPLNLTDNGQAIFEVIRLGTSGLHVLQRITMKTNGDVYIRCNNSTSSPYTFFEWTKH